MRSALFPWRGAAVALWLTAAASCADGDRTSVRLGDTVPRLPTSEAIGTDGALTADAITRDMVALGDSIFHGLAAGGTCVTCHGPAAQGGVHAPNLRDDVWLNGDGSYDWIVHVVHDGVAPPRVYPVAMPPDGGGSLTTSEERAVAAYVYSLRGSVR